MYDNPHSDLPFGWHRRPLSVRMYGLQYGPSLVTYIRAVLRWNS